VQRRDICKPRLLRPGLLDGVHGVEETDFVFGVLGVRGFGFVDVDGWVVQEDSLRVV
jgi:hypothetical protein